jgi:hypothetical protein
VARIDFEEIEDLKKLEKMMEAKGVERLFVKKLSPNDNSKNQVYLGGDFESLNIIPNKGVYVDGGREGSKRDRFKADISLFWMDHTGNLYPVPAAQLILYPKYPEVRMSGFLKGCEKAPSEMMTSREEGRLMFFGICRDGSVIGHVTGPRNPVYKQIESMKRLELAGVFLAIPFRTTQTGDTQDALIRAMKSIHMEGWINSVKLCADGSLAPCKSSNCGGYTLEARLGVKPNGYSEPDFLGWEVKQHGVKSFSRPHSGGPVTLMTPEPTGGIYRDKGAEAFLRKFGYADRIGREDRINFGGVYKFGKPVDLTKITLQMPGYDPESGKITKPDGGLTLVGPRGEEAAIWHYADMMRHWNRKHAKAVYIPSLCETEPRRRYKYGNFIELGIGTDFLKFLAAVASGKIYYDRASSLRMHHRQSRLQNVVASFVSNRKI